MERAEALPGKTNGDHLLVGGLDDPALLLLLQLMDRSRRHHLGVLPRLLDGQHDGEGAAETQLGLGNDGPVVGLHQALGDAEPRPGRRGLPLHRVEAARGTLTRPPAAGRGKGGRAHGRTMPGLFPSKMVLRRAGWMPMPVSLTSILTRAYLMSSAVTTTSPRLVNLRPLPIRLLRMRLIRIESPVMVGSWFLNSQRRSTPCLAMGRSMSQVVWIRSCSNSKI